MDGGLVDYRFSDGEGGKITSCMESGGGRDRRLDVKQGEKACPRLQNKEEVIDLLISWRM